MFLNSTVPWSSIILVGVIMSAAGAIIAGIATYKSNKIASNQLMRSDRIRRNAEEEITRLTKDVIRISTDSRELNRKNEELNRKNNELTLIVKNYVKGGDTWVYLAPSKRTKDSYSLYILPKGGQTPIEDVRIQIMKRTLNSGGIEAGLSLVKDKKVGILNPLAKFDFVREVIWSISPSEIWEEYLIHISAKNGGTRQHIIFAQMENGDWSIATKAVKISLYYDDKGGYNFEDVHTFIDKGFPKSKDEIKWSFE